MVTMTEKTKYSDEELEEFKALINGKLKKAQEENGILEKLIEGLKSDGSDLQS